MIDSMGYQIGFDIGVAGESCSYCHEAVLPSERIFRDMGGKPHHRECIFRMVVGSVAHIEGRCSCFIPGSDEADPEGMSTREAAIAAYKLRFVNEVKH